MQAADYLGAVALVRERVTLTGRLPASPWDLSLREAMVEGGVAVHEEELRADLLSAMARESARGAELGTAGQGGQVGGG